MSRMGEKFWKVEHLAAAAAGAIIFLLIYAYSGDADLLFDVVAGAVGAVASYVSLWLHARKGS